MTHNKMYREIEGYEDALYQTTDTIDLLNDLYELIQNGESTEKIKEMISKIETNVNEIKEKTKNKQPYKISISREW